jgi:HK97 family phage major capsid protein
MKKTQELQEKVNAKRVEIKSIFDAGGEDLNLDEDQVEDIQTKNAELEAAQAELESALSMEKIEAKNREDMAAAERVNRSVSFASGDADQPSDTPVEQKSLGDLFIDSIAFKDYQSGNHRGPLVEEPYEVKTLMTESAGFSVRDPRTGQVVPSAQQQPRVVDIIPQTTTNATSIIYMRETTYTNAAAEVAEGGAYAEAALAYTEVTSPVRKIAVFLPVTDEQLADVPAMRDRINNRLDLMLRQRLDQQVVSGNGTPPNLTGILNTAGIQTQARGTDPNPDALHKAITLARTIDFSEPNAILMHPNNWQSIRLLRTADGLYIFGDPGMTGTQRLWGLPVVTTTYMTLNSAIVADFQNYTDLAYRAGIEFEVSNSHTDYFQKGILAIRAQLRVAFQIYRPTAVVSVTGLN